MKSSTVRPEGSRDPAPAANLSPNGDTLRKLIREDIIAGWFLPGQRLIVGDLSRRYGASSQPIRDALNQLQGEGFVVLSPNRGASVRIVDEDFVRNVFEIRALLEPMLVERYCRYCNEASLSALERAEELFEEAAEGGRFEEVEARNLQFHSLIFESDSNVEAIEVLYRYAGMLQTHRAHLHTAPYRSHARISEHRAIIAALRSRDPVAAAAAAAGHVRRAGQDFLQAMRQARVTIGHPPARSLT